MAINASGVFSTSTTTSSAAAYWKPVTPPAAGTATAAGSTGDTVAVSKLGQALTGSAADAFQHLNPKARQMLEDFVNAGMASADDVVRGLKCYATRALRERYHAEAPRDEEEIKSAEKIAELRKINKDYSSKYSISERVRINKEITDLAVSTYEKKQKAFLGLELGPDNHGANRATTDEEDAAASKLADLGFHVVVFRGDFREYAKTVDIPGIGRSAPQGPMPASSPATAPQTASAPTAATEEPPAATDPAVMAAEQAASAAERLQATLNTGAAAGAAANGQSAVTLLQSALGGGAAASGLLAAQQQPAGNSLLETLSRSLKPS